MSDVTAKPPVSREWTGSTIRPSRWRARVYEHNALVAELRSRPTREDYEAALAANARLNDEVVWLQGRCQNESDWMQQAKAAEAKLAVSEAEWLEAMDKVREDCNHKLSKLSDALAASEAEQERLREAISRALEWEGAFRANRLEEVISVLRAALAPAAGPEEG